jgi:hypothetical protein
LLPNLFFLGGQVAKLLGHTFRQRGHILIAHQRRLGRRRGGSRGWCRCRCRGGVGRINTGNLGRWRSSSRSRSWIGHHVAVGVQNFIHRVIIIDPGNTLERVNVICRKIITANRGLLFWRQRGQLCFVKLNGTHLVSL